jgi:uncharacterized protein YndB with AHSA1/START domain
MIETSGTSVVTTPSDREVHVERVFDAPRDAVWRAFTEHDIVCQWWGRGNVVDVVRDEVVRGGHWRYIEHAPEGDEGFEGRYRDVVAPEMMSRTFEWDGAPGHVSVEEARFEEVDGGRTKLTVTDLFMTAEDRDAMFGAGMVEGMNESYAALDALLARLG